MPGRISKTAFVEQWWIDCLKAGNNLLGLTTAEHRELRALALVLPEHPAKTWKARVGTDYVWLSFKNWLDAECPMVLDQFNKNGFMTIFYRVSETKKAVIRTGDKRHNAVRFENVSSHRDRMGMKV